MRLFLLLLFTLPFCSCQRQLLATNTWYESAEIVCQRQNCHECRGTRGTTCPPCRGAGGVKCTSCKDGTATCGTCDGDGQKKGKKCQTCDGKGKHNCYTCGGDKIMDCDHCSAKGKICCLQRIRLGEPGVQNEDDAWPLGTYDPKK